LKNKNNDTTTLCISNGGQSAIYEMIMNIMNESANMKVSAEKTATTHTQARYKIKKQHHNFYNRND